MKDITTRNNSGITSVPFGYGKEKDVHLASFDKDGMKVDLNYREESNCVVVCVGGEAKRELIFPINSDGTITKWNLQFPSFALGVLFAREIYRIGNYNGTAKS